jgi:hypothetical protein
VFLIQQGTTCPHNIGKMFHYGERPWHKLGTKLNQAATVSEALDYGCLDWEVGFVPMITAEQPASVVTHRLAVVRTDRRPGHAKRVIRVVHAGFRPLQNCAGVPDVRCLIGRGQRLYHTGGCLGEGEVVWRVTATPTSSALWERRQTKICRPQARCRGDGLRMNVSFP